MRLQLPQLLSLLQRVVRKLKVTLGVEYILRGTHSGPSLNLGGRLLVRTEKLGLRGLARVNFSHGLILAIVIVMLVLEGSGSYGS